MLVQDAQREVRTVFVGGFWGQLVSSIIWLASAGLGTWVSPKASIWTVVVAGFFIYPLTQLLLRLNGRRASVSPDNPLGKLGMQIAFAGGLPILLLVPVTEFRLTLFYPALMVIMGAHYLPFTFLYGMRIFMPLGVGLAGCGVVLAFYAPGSFSLGAWIGGCILFVFAWIARIVVGAEDRI
ncbi:MAG TPA: hypothetical protein VE077_13475 [Candidatus Methylomirabilis sp.]|nr:hypothetical protein [Candidatus Methylomirabilis sp.]